MKIELKKLKVSASLSEETTAFTAEVWVDGKRMFHASNHGTGGSNDYHPIHSHTYEDLKAVEAYCKTLPKHKYDFGNGQAGELDMDLDMVVSELIEQAEEEKQLKRWCKTKTVVREKDAEKGIYLTFKFNWTTADVMARSLFEGKVVTKYPGCEIINKRFA